MALPRLWISYKVRTKVESDFQNKLYTFVAAFKVNLFSCLLIVFNFVVNPGNAIGQSDRDTPYNVEVEGAEVKISEGKLSLKNVSIKVVEDRIIKANRDVYKSEYDSIEAKVVNSTGKTIPTAYIKIKLYRNGEIVESDEKQVVDIPPGKSELSRSLFFFDEGKYRKEGDNVKISIPEITTPVEYNITMVEPEKSSSNVFEDRKLRVKFIIQEGEVSFYLKNKSNNSIKINWNNVSFVDISGTANSVIHKGVKYSNAEQPMSPTTIPPKASIEDLVHPTSMIPYNSTVGWNKDPVIPDDIKIGKNYPNKVKEFRNDVVGKHFSIYMPMEIGSSTRKYNFRFEITDIDI